MARHSDNGMVQLAALLCLIPLALENHMMQVGVRGEGNAIWGSGPGVGVD